MKKIDENIYAKVVEAFNNAYTPYSNFNVGAVLKLKNGQYISGSNIENASYGLTICAERNALFNAYSQGYRKDDLEELLVIAKSSRPISPCGACRQVISELMNSDARIVLTNFKKELVEFRVSELLPYSFNDGDLKNEE